jgi:two-component system phosphate regulon response regulator PhoB
MPDRHTVLIVEDDTDLRRMYRAALAVAGYDVQEAGDGFEALRRLDWNPPDVVVLDLMLPTVSGHIVCQEIAESATTRHIPIVVVTGSEDELADLEVSSLLRKPVSPDQLIEAVKTCLGADQKAGS